MRKNILNKIIVLVLVSFSLINIILPTFVLAIEEEYITDLGTVGSSATSFTYDEDNQIGNIPYNIVRFKVPKTGEYIIIQYNGNTPYYVERPVIYLDFDSKEMPDNGEDLFVDGFIHGTCKLEAGVSYYMQVDRNWTGVRNENTRRY